MTTPPLATARDHHRHLQRRRRHVELPDRGLRRLRRRSMSVGEPLSAERHGHVEGGVEAELLGLLPQRVVAELDAELAEGRVARAPQGVAQRGRVVARSTARRPGSAASTSVSGRSSSAGPGISARRGRSHRTRQRRGRRDDLERRPRRVGLAQRPVEQRLARVGVERRPSASQIFGPSWEESAFGSYDGVLTIARIAPVAGRSRDDRARPGPASPSNAACWAARVEREQRRCRPALLAGRAGRRSRPHEAAGRRCRRARSFSARSMPAAP